MKKIILLLLIIGLFATAHATTWFVSTTGSDSNPCTSASPCLTPAHAFNSVALAGDTVQVAAGTYNGGNAQINLTNGGTSGNPITLTCVTVRACTLETSLGGGSLTNNAIIEIDGSNVVLDGFLITSTNTSNPNINLGIYITSSNVTVKRSTIHDFNPDCGSAGGGGINVATGGGSGDVFDANIVFNVGNGNPACASANTVHGINFEPNGSATGTITNNILYNNNGGWGIQFQAAAVGSTGSVIANNTIFSNGNGGIVIVQAGGTADFNTITNNIILDNGTQQAKCGIKELSVTGTNSVYDYNDAFGNAGSDYCFTSGTQGIHNISVNPTLNTTFVNWQSNGSGDYHEKAGSPTIATGTSSGAPNHDFDGNPRPSGSGFDIGAYQVVLTQLNPPLFTQGDATILPYSSFILFGGTFPYMFPSLGIVPGTSGGAIVTDQNSGFGGRAAAETAQTRCVTKDGSTPTSSPAGTCANGIQINNTGTFSLTGTATLKAISTQVGFLDSNVTTITMTINTFWPLPGSYSYGVTPAITGNDGGNVIYTIDGSTPTADTSCNATHGTALTNGNTIPALAVGTTNVKMIPCNGGVSGTVQTGTYVVNAAAQTWYVRTDGGTRFSSVVTTGQCNGKFDVAYPGSGTNQNCAFNDVRYLWDDDGRGGGPGAWVISGGDIVIIHGCTALGTQSNPSNPNCRIGWDQNNGGAGNSWCFAVGNQGCTNPPIPVGNATHHTVIEGGCAANSTCNPVNTYPYTSNLAQIFAGFGLQYSFNLQHTAYVDINGIEFTTHNGVCSHGYNPGYPHACNTSTPEDFADNGIFFDNFSSNITLTDVYIHGFNSSGIFGPIGGLVTNTRVIDSFNGFSGHNMNDNSNTPNWPTGSSTYPGAALVEHFVWREGNGCTEEYPISHTTFPALGCWDGNNGGFGDAGPSGQDSNIVSYTADHLTTIYNVKDGTLGPHTAYSSVNVSDSVWYGNVGQQWKWGGQVNSTSLFQNNEVEGNCNRMSTQLPGARQNFNQSTGLGGSYIQVFCRAAGNIIDFLSQTGSTSGWYGNTFIMNGQDGILFDCGPAGGGFTNCGNVVNTFKDNIFLGYTNPTFGSASHLFSSITGSNNNATITFAVEQGLLGQGVCGSNGIICSDPLLTNEPVLPWPGSESNFDNFNWLPRSISPAIAAGTAIGSLTVDFNNNPRPNPPSDGVLEQAAGAMVQTPTATPPSGVYQTAQSVVLSDATAGATICYTTNGNTPTAATPGTCDVGSTTYTGPINVAVNTTIKAIGTLAGFINSNVATFVYNIGGSQILKFSGTITINGVVIVQ